MNTCFYINIIFKFIFATILPTLVINYCLYFLPKDLGYCPFPRLQNLAYQVQLENQVGIEKIFINRTDFGCNWFWLKESIEVKDTTKPTIYQYALYGRNEEIHEPLRHSVFINENIYKFDEPMTKESFNQFITSESPRHLNDSNWKEIDLPKYDRQHILSQARCSYFTERKELCVIYLAHQSLIVQITFNWHTDSNFTQEMLQLIEKTSQRLLEYNQSP